MTSNGQQSNVGVVGLGVMGRSMALNLADNGFNVGVFDVDSTKVSGAVEQDLTENKGISRLHAADDMAAFVNQLTSPRVVILSVPAGEIVDRVCQGLIDAGIESQDIVIDTGNSQWQDSVSRQSQYADNFNFFTCAVSGGEQGARFGPALMASGTPESWEIVKPLFEGMAAKVDPETGKPRERNALEQPMPVGEACAAYIGPVGSGHYVKMVHNGIEYADMQLIAEAYHLMRDGLGMDTKAISRVFHEWNRGELGCYLLEITADILAFNDPQTQQPMVDVILDKAGQKGTGAWTGINSLTVGCPTPSITQAVYARAMSGLKAERVAASAVFAKPTLSLDPEAVQLRLNELHDAMLCSKIAIYAQGFQLMQMAAKEHGWQLDYVAIAKIWRAGCIIRANVLHPISQAFSQASNADGDIPNLMMCDAFAALLNERQQNWRELSAWSLLSGIPCPSMTSALNYFDAYRTAVLPANVIQAQRDFFGAHLFQRIDDDSGSKYHVQWHKAFDQRTCDKMA